MSEPKPGARVFDDLEEDPPYWMVISVTDEDVHLSGPGPCRGIKVVPRAWFDESWVIADDA